LYLHNLTAILADRGTLASTGRLDYSLAQQPATVHEMLLQKSDGTFELVVWGERLRGADEITVRFGKAQPTLRAYDPSVGTEPVRTLDAADAITLTVSDHPLIVEIPRE
jgi:hypothetical protein